MKYIDMDMRRPHLIKNLLEMWDRTLGDFEKVMTINDLPYIYGERTNIGFLAAAATKIELVVLEEYALQKRKGRQSKQGRADLYLCSKDGSFDINIEAKLKELSWNSRRASEVIKPVLQDAVNDVDKVHPSENPKCSLGIVFVRLYNANPNEFDPGNFWTQLGDRTSFGADFCAMHLCRYEVWSQQKYNEGYPGIGIVGKFLR